MIDNLSAKPNEMIIFKVEGTELKSKKIPSDDWAVWAGWGWKGTEAMAMAAVEKTAAESVPEPGGVVDLCDRALAAYEDYLAFIQKLNEKVQRQGAIVDPADEHWMEMLNATALTAGSFSPKTTIEAIKHTFG